MMCIRCGAQVQPSGSLLVTSDGGCTCSNARPGEAAVHRVAEKPMVLPKNRSWAPALIHGLLGFAAGRAVGNLILGGPHQGPAPVQAVSPPTSYVDQANQYFQSR